MELCPKTLPTGDEFTRKCIVGAKHYILIIYVIRIGEMDRTKTDAGVPRDTTFGLRQRTQ